MSFETARDYLVKMGYEKNIRTFDVSSATVELAAKAIGTEPEKIAKSLTFKVGNAPVMVVCAGDTKVSNGKFKAFFSAKAKMLTSEEVSELIGHTVGGVCPFGIKDGVKVYLDESLKRFDTVYPACGNSNSAVALTLSELEEASGFIEWIDICNS